MPRRLRGGRLGVAGPRPAVDHQPVHLLSPAVGLRSLTSRPVRRCVTSSLSPPRRAPAPVCRRPELRERQGRMIRIGSGRAPHRSGETARRGLGEAGVHEAHAMRDALSVGQLPNIESVGTGLPPCHGELHRLLRMHAAQLCDSRDCDVGSLVLLESPCECQSQRSTVQGTDAGSAPLGDGICRRPHLGGPRPPAPGARRRLAPGRRHRLTCWQSVRQPPRRSWSPLRVCAGPPTVERRAPA